MLFFQTLGLALLSIGALSVFARRTVTVAMFYWTGWLMGISAAISLSGDGVLPPFTEHGQWLVLQLHIGACLGFVTAAIFYHVIVAGVLGPGRISTHQRDTGDTLYISPQVVRVAMALQLLLGSIILATRLKDAGGFAGLTTLMNLRATFLQSTYLVKELPLAVRLSTHLGLMLAAFPFLFAMQDALSGRPRIMRLLAWWLASVPAGLSTGGRGWIITTPSLYAFSYLVCSGSSHGSAGLRRLMRRGVVALLAMVALFGLVERMRTKDSLSTALLERSGGGRWYQAVPSLIPVVYYFGLPTLAVDEHASFSATMPRHGGTLTFPFETSQLARLGLQMGQGSVEDFTSAVRGNSFYGRYPILSATHATIIPDLVGDFGTQRIPFVMAMICFAMEFSYLFLRRRGIVPRFVAVQIVTLGGFWVFQEFGLGQAAAVLPILWLMVLTGLAVLSQPKRRQRWLRLDRRPFPSFPADPAPARSGPLVPVLP